MQTIEPVVRASVLAAFRDVVVAAHGDPARLLATVGLSDDDIAHPERYISLNTVAELFELAARTTKDHSFGLHYAEAFPKGGSGLLGHLMLTAPTVGAVMEVVAEYIDVYAMMMSARIEHHDDTYSFHLSYPPKFTAPQLHHTGFLLATLVLRLRLGAGSAWRPYAVEFAHRKPDDPRAYQSYFGNRLTFDAPRYRMDVDAADFVKPMPKLLDRLSDTVRDLGNRVLLETRARQSTEDRVFSILSQRIENEQPFDLEALATELDVPVRTLQWRLDQSGTSYERLLTRTRKQMALHLLRDTDLPIAQIAIRLGYSEASAFARAGQKWFKETPSAYRRRLRDGSPGLDADTAQSGDD